jgi:hypothetical protein
VFSSSSADGVDLRARPQSASLFFAAFDSPSDSLSSTTLIHQHDPIVFWVVVAPVALLYASSRPTVPGSESR